MRTKSLRRESNSKSKPNVRPATDNASDNIPLPTESHSNIDLGSNKSRDVRSKGKRAKSTDRSNVAITSESDENLASERQHVKEKDKEKDKGGFMTGSKNVMSKAKAGAKSGGGSFLTRLSKIGRSGSHGDKDAPIPVPDNEYTFKVINLPLIEQTKATRISKDLSKCRDKTEFWMPALPWRCIE